MVESNNTVIDVTTHDVQVQQVTVLTIVIHGLVASEQTTTTFK